MLWRHKTVSNRNRSEKINIWFIRSVLLIISTDSKIGSAWNRVTNFNPIMAISVQSKGSRQNNTDLFSAKSTFTAIIRYNCKERVFRSIEFRPESLFAWSDEIIRSTLRLLRIPFKNCTSYRSYMIHMKVYWSPNCTESLIYMTPKCCP